MTEGRFDFDDVRASELEAINNARKKIGTPVADKSSLFGLAFSGGGIRSATFNLGVLQGLSRAGLLKQVDYLSTVSGGGYIGSWLSAWIRREDRDVTVVEAALSNPPAQKSVEPRPIGWLRRYSNYLTARVSLFSTDTLAAVATYLRNLLLNQIELVAFLAAVLMLPLLLAWRIKNPGVPWLWLGVGTLAVAVTFINLNLFHRDLAPGAQADFYQKPKWIICLVLAPLIVSGLAFGVAVAEMASSDFVPFVEAYWPPAFALMIALQIVSWLIHKMRAAGSFANTYAVLKDSAYTFARGKAPTQPAQYRYGPIAVMRIVLGLGVAVAVGLAGLWLFRETLPSAIRTNAPVEPQAAAIWHVTVWAAPVALTTFGLGTVFFIGIVGRVFAEEVREWWSRLGGLILWVLFAWILVAASSVYGPYLVGLLGGWLNSVGVTWILTSLAGIFAGRSRFSSGADKGAAASDTKAWVDWIAKLAPYVFIAGLLLLVVTAVHGSLLMVTEVSSAAKAMGDLYWTTTFASHAVSLMPPLDAQGGCAMLTVFGALAVVVALLSLTLDINVFSFHMFYRNRLVRCYLGASNGRAAGDQARKHRRRPHPFTDFDPTDSPAMTDLAAQRPYHLVNTAINLTSAKNLAWQERKAASFLISPLYCGYDLDPAARPQEGRYQCTAEYLAGSNGWLPLGTALTISGAAASPNMGYHTSAATALLLSVFNVRLGWWMQNTRCSGDWARKGPRIGILWMIYELFALAHEERRFVYLSDGGHFENLGIYELVKRRCRFIVAVDAGCDPKFNFADLGNAVRKCQGDLGARINIDVRAIKPAANTRNSLFHCAVGQIHYPANGADKEQEGLLLYIKPSLTGNEPADVTEYAAAHSDFPHQTTADQWFDESQFESYRNLGQHVTETVLESVRASNQPEWIFQNLKERWYRPASAASGAFARHADQLKSIEETLRRDKNLEFMDGQLIPEWSRLLEGTQPMVKLMLGLPAESEQRRAGFYVCTTMLQLMESVYLDLNLEEEWNHPDNRGWMNLFKHWSWSGMFMATYSICCGMVGARFQRWCERHLEMFPGKVCALVPKAGSDVVSWLQELERKDQINFVELSDLSAKSQKGDLVVMKPGHRLVLLRMECRPGVTIPDHRGGTKDALISFTFGIAVVSERSYDAHGNALPNALVYFRIQDHMRRMGLARRAMRELIHGKDLQVENVCFPDGASRKSEIERLFITVKQEPTAFRDRTH